MVQDTNIDSICHEQQKTASLAFRKASIFPKFSANNNFLCITYFSYPHLSIPLFHTLRSVYHYYIF